MVAPIGSLRSLVARLGGPGCAASVLLVASGLLALAGALDLVGTGFDRFVDAPHAPPSAEYWLGTDALGRSVSDRSLRGTQVSLLTGITAALASVGSGAVLGTVAGLRGGSVDRVLLSGAQTIAAIPPLVTILAVGFVLGPTIATAAIAIAISQWVSVFRSVRAEAQRLATADFVRASYAMGAAWPHVLRRHVMPNLIPLLSTSLTLHFVYAVKAEAVLGFLGLSAPGLPSWGRMLAEGASELARGIWWPVAAAALPLALVVLSAQVIADRLER